MARPPITPITVTEGSFDSDDIKKTHPAFGMACFHRISGNPGRLFGSEITSLGTSIQLTIAQGEDHWHLHEHWFHGGKTIAEIEMTPAQFAELLTSMNVGGGVPCTIRYANGEEVPGFEDEDTLHKLIKDDLKADTKELSGLAGKLSAELDTILAETSLSKAKKERLTGIVAKLRQAIDSNMPFVLAQYVEAVEKVTANAKAEVDSFVTHTLTTLGMDSLKQIKQAGAATDVVAAATPEIGA